MGRAARCGLSAAKRAGRRDSRPLRVLFLAALAGLLCAGAANRVSAAPCSQPKYVVALDLTDPAVSAGGVMQVSIERRDFTVAGVVCLARALRAAHPLLQELLVNFFDSPERAQIFPEGATVTETNYRVRATYMLSSSPPSETLTLNPLGTGIDESFDDRLDLSGRVDPVCRRRLDGRCLLAFGDFDVSDDWTGSATLTAQLLPSGAVSAVRLVSTTARSVAGTPHPMSGLQNWIKSWWFEPADRQRSLRITAYSDGKAPPLEADDLRVPLAGGSGFPPPPPKYPCPCAHSHVPFLT